MEDMLKQILNGLKKLNDSADRIDERLKRLETHSPMPPEPGGRLFQETGTIRNHEEPVSSSGNLELIWEKVLDILKEELTEVSFKTWLKVIKPVSIDDHVLCLGVQTEFEKGILETRYDKLIETALWDVTMKSLAVRFFVFGDDANKKLSAKKKTSGDQIMIPSLNSKYSFDAFVVGEHNKLAYNCAVDIAKNGYKHRKLIYFYGKVGMGKTHLIQAVGNYISEHRPAAQVKYMSIDDFTNEMINAVRYDNLPRLEEMLLGHDVLIFDNLQFIIGKERTQAEFFKIASGLVENGRLVIVAATKPPQDMAIMNEQFTSMFELGGVFEIKQPDPDTRMEILRRKLAEADMMLPDEEIHIIAERASKNVRELLNALNRIVAYAKMNDEEINSSFIEDFFAATASFLL